MIQIGTEGGFLPAPAVIPNQPVNYTYNRKNIVVAERPAARAAPRTGGAGRRHRRLLQLRRQDPHPLQRRDPRRSRPLTRASTTTRATRWTRPPPAAHRRRCRATVPTPGPSCRSWSTELNGADRRCRNDYVDPALSWPRCLAGACTGLPPPSQRRRTRSSCRRPLTTPAYGTSVVDVPGANLVEDPDTSLTFTPLVQRHRADASPCGRRPSRSCSSSTTAG